MLISFRGHHYDGNFTKDSTILLKNHETDQCFGHPETNMSLLRIEPQTALAGIVCSTKELARHSSQYLFDHSELLQDRNISEVNINVLASHTLVCTQPTWLFIS